MSDQHPYAHGTFGDAGCRYPQSPPPVSPRAGEPRRQRPGAVAGGSATPIMVAASDIAATEDARLTPTPHFRFMRAPAAAPVATLVVAAAASAYLYRTDPHQSGHWLPRCPFNWMTGLLCPACGGTRLAYDLLHGDVLRAFHENALMFVLSPVMLWLFGRWVVEGLRGRRWQPVLAPRAQYALMVVAVLWTVVRNVR